MQRLKVRAHLAYVTTAQRYLQWIPKWIVMALPKRNIRLVACLLALVQLFLYCQAKEPEWVYPDLCKHKDVELRGFYDFYHTSFESCSPEIRKVINEFNEMTLVERPYSRYGICHMDHVTNITSFYQAHLARKDDEGPTLPKQFKQFVVSYGMQVASKCKSHLIKNFYEFAMKTLDKDDFEALSEWTDDKGPIARLLDPILKQAEFLLPSDFTAQIPEFEANYKLAVKLTDSKKFIRAQEVCEKRFRPLYGNIVLPLALLARNGFNYNNPKLKHDLMMKRNVRKQNTLWSRIVFLCESLKEFQFIAAPPCSPPELSDSVTEADNEMMEAGGEEKDSVVATELRQLEPYLPRIILWEPYLGPADFRLNAVVNSYDATKSEADRLRKRLLTNKGKLRRAAFKSKETTASLVRTAFGIVTRTSGDKENEDLENAKKHLLSLLNSDKRSKFFKAITMMAKGSKSLLRLLARTIEYLLGRFGALLRFVFFETIGFCARHPMSV